MSDKPNMDGTAPAGDPPPVSAKRAAPPRVAPVGFENVVYRQLMGGEAEAQGSGVLAAEDASGGRLWTLKVYDVRYEPALERDVQEVYFTSMELDRDSRSLVIANERGERYSVDLDVRKVTRLD